MSNSSERWLSPLLALVIASACTTGGGTAAEEGNPKDPKDPKSEIEVKVSVASVQMIQDCPDEEPEPSDAAALAEDVPSSERRTPSPGAAAQPMGDVADGGSFRQPCDQSTVQLALENKGDAPVGVEIKAVRILSKGKVVGKLETRKPKIWTNNTYEAWDQTVAPSVPTKASYKLSMPSWSEVEEKLGQSSYGHMFTLELDVVIGGEVQTVSSQEFPREEPHVIVT
jgi:hypothetical protein